MNYLAHLALTPLVDDMVRQNSLRIGNLLGDFVKGTESSLRIQLPADLVDGIVLHRAIDKFTDKHPSFIASKQLLAPKRRRYAGIVLDIIYDHFLSIHWQCYNDQSLDDFITQVYKTIDENKEWQLGNLKHIFPTMMSENWLSRYISISGIEETFKRVATRGKYTSPITNTHIDFKQHYSTFEKHFHLIYKDLIEFKDNFKF